MGQAKITIRSLINASITTFVVPVTLYILFLNGLILLWTLNVCLVVFFIVFIIFPFIFSCSWTLQRAVLFLNYANYPKVNFSQSWKIIEDSCNFYVNVAEDVRLGTWYIMPNYLRSTSKSKKDNDSNNIILDKDEENQIDFQIAQKMLMNGMPVLVYMHGNAGNRATAHRVEAYNLFRKYFHVIAVDYRGYGDSSDLEPNEVNCVKDMVVFLQYIKTFINGPLYVWGHSLGTGIAAHALDILAQTDKIEITGLVLECPFNNLHDEIYLHPIAAPFKDLPWFEYFVTDPMNNNGLLFETDKHVLNFNAPILILHAEDDGTVPYKLGIKLYEETKMKRNVTQGAVYFKGFESKLNLGHNWIHRDSSMSQVLLDYIKNTTNFEIYEKISNLKVSNGIS